MPDDVGWTNISAYGLGVMGYPSQTQASRLCYSRTEYKVIQRWDKLLVLLFAKQKNPGSIAGIGFTS